MKRSFYSKRCAKREQFFFITLSRLVLILQWPQVPLPILYSRLGDYTLPLSQPIHNWLVAIQPLQVPHPSPLRGIAENQAPQHRSEVDFSQDRKCNLVVCCVDFGITCAKVHQVLCPVLSWEAVVLKGLLDGGGVRGFVVSEVG